MACKDEGGASFERVLNRGKRGFDALVAGDLLPAGRERHIEIDTHEDSLVLEVQVTDR
jgi:hypothetical protein